MAETFDTADLLISEIAAVLAERGPMTEERLLAALRDGGVTLDEDPEYALEEALADADGLLTVLADGRWASVPALLTGRVFTHRLTALEVEHDFLEPDPDLTPVGILAGYPGHQRLVDGSPLLPVVPGTGVELPETIGGALLLPPGYLRGRGLSKGDTVALRVTGAGVLLEEGPGQAGTAEQLAVLGRALNDELAGQPGAPLELYLVLFAACASDPALFTEPLPPLREALAACGLAYDGEWLAPAGFDFRQWRADVHRATIAQRHGLDEETASAVLAVLTQYKSVDGAADELGAAVSSLAEAPVAEAVLAEIPTDDVEAAATLVRFAESAEPMAPRAARPALRWLLGKAHERLGDVVKAEAAYTAAESLDPQWPPALYDLARFAGDRGDAARGLALLRRAGAPPDDLLVELFERFQAGPRTDVGRNDPCWCGSGRKYKKCHLGRESLTLDERASWLYQKADLFLGDGPWGGAMMAAAEVRAASAGDPYALLEALDDPLTADAVLFEGGAFADFVATRGRLLPEDERLLAEQWLLVERSVFEVEQVRHGEGLTLRDVRTGDIHQVSRRMGDRRLTKGTLICARVVPAGETEQIFGGIEPVAVHERDELIALLDAAPDPETLISFLSRRFAPPEPENTEGGPPVLRAVTPGAEDPAALAADELDETYERDGVPRTFGPKLTVVRESRSPETEEAPSAASPSPSGTGLAAVVEQFVREYEQKWLDEPLPALSGRTPRQAAADPARRGDLTRLLDSFPDRQGEPGAMDPDRLRVALGLD